jgi:hypothetical protein
MKLNEDWWSVIVAAILIILGWVGVLGKAQGLINIPW